MAEKGCLGVYCDIIGQNDVMLKDVCADEYHNFLDTSPNTEKAFRADCVPKETRKPKTDMREVNTLNAELNPIRHLLALVGARHFVHVSRIRVKTVWEN